MVIWVIGLSQSGKTTISDLVYEKLKPVCPNLIRLDGDVIRALIKNDVDHTVKGRLKNAERISTLSKFLADQGIHVIAAVLSIFPEWQEWNRKNIPDYAEVYLKTSLEVVTKRDKNNLYKRALEGKLKDVVGVDIPFPEPKKADLTIDNNECREDFNEIVDKILALNVVPKNINL